MSHSRYFFVPKRILGCLSILVGIFFLTVGASCSSNRVTAGREIRERDAQRLVSSRATRRQIAHELGPPDGMTDDGRQTIWEWTVRHQPAPGWCGIGDMAYQDTQSMTFYFDDAGRAISYKHSRG